MKPEVSIIIVNYKAKKELFKCIDSIYLSKPKVKYEIIIVDNDEIRSINHELKKLFPGVLYVRSGKNLGYGGGNNLGAKYANGECLFFLNPDTKIQKNTIDALYNFFKKNKNVGIVSPLILNENQQPLKYQGYKELTPLNGIFTFSFLRKKFPSRTISSFYSLKDWDKNPIKQVDTIYGAALMIQASVFKKVNMFDENFFLYFEENDLSRRVRKTGLKLYVNSFAKIVHKVGQSTKQISNRDDYFVKSRYLYFKKHFGLISALLVEGLLKINKISLFILIILTVSLFLRIYNLSQSMVFIGDQGWFYLSARDMITTGNIPLVGITSSHTWLHQGSLWTYFLAIVLWLSNFNPLSGGYLTAFLGVATTFLIYKLCSKVFSNQIGIISAVLYAFSPLVIVSDRMPFDPSVIPFFTIFYFYVFYKWIKGRINYFPLTIFFLALLYNLELSTFTLFIPWLLFFAYGLFKRKNYILKLFNKKTIFYSVIAFLIPMLPVIIYDVNHGFKQTLVFAGWVIYKPFSLLINHSNLFSGSFQQTINFLLNNLQKLIFYQSASIAILIFILSVIYLVMQVYKIKKNTFSNAKTILIVFLLISFLGIIINSTPSDAYLPIIFPFVIIMLGVFFSWLVELRNIRYLAILVILMICMLNGYNSLKVSVSTSEFKNRLEAVDKVISLADKKEYNLIGKGIGSQFSSFTMNYEYLLWWKGYPPSKRSVNLKIYVSEIKDKIVIEAYD